MKKGTSLLVGYMKRYRISILTIFLIFSSVLFLIPYFNRESKLLYSLETYRKLNQININNDGNLTTIRYHYLNKLKDKIYTLKLSNRVELARGIILLLKSRGDLDNVNKFLKKVGFNEIKVFKSFPYIYINCDYGSLEKLLKKNISEIALSNNF